MLEREIKKVRTITDNLDKYDILANSNDFVTVTEWANREGYDINVNDNKIFSLTQGEIDAIDYLTKTLSYIIEKKED